MDKTYIRIVPAQEELTLFLSPCWYTYLYFFLKQERDLDHLFCNILSRLPILGLRKLTRAKFNLHSALASHPIIS